MTVMKVQTNIIISMTVMKVQTDIITSMTVMKVQTDIITSMTVITNVILATMYVKTFKTDIIVFISNVIMCLMLH